MVRYGDADVAGILAAHGLTLRSDGYSCLDLEAVIAARGWQCLIEPAGSRPAGRHPKKRFRAMVMASGHDVISDDRRGRSLGMRHTRGSGASETVALALALARMLVHIATES
jgi:hypothetical protein